jgi:hypothetical protein
MRTAHLIIAHKSPEQIERMIRRLQHPDFDFYIHLDKKVNIELFANIKLLENVYFIKNRVDARWGCYNLSKAILVSVVEICNSGREYNFINHISGQDYPLKPVEYLVEFFKSNSGKEFITHRDIVHDWKEAQMRYNRFHFINFRINGKIIVGSEMLAKAARLILGKRKTPYNLHPYGGSAFWMLSPEVALFAANKVLNNKRIKRFFTYTWGSDEFVFQTIILNSVYKDRVINENYRYIDWEGAKEHPKTLKVEDFDKIRQSSMLFARKFDVDQDEKILDMIDSTLLLNNKF